MSKYGTEKLQDALELIGEDVFVIDTPGLQDTKASDKKHIIT